LTPTFSDSIHHQRVPLAVDELWKRSVVLWRGAQPPGKRRHLVLPEPAEVVFTGPLGNRAIVARVFDNDPTRERPSARYVLVAVCPYARMFPLSIWDKTDVDFIEKSVARGSRATRRSSRLRNPAARPRQRSPRIYRATCRLPPSTRALASPLPRTAAAPSTRPITPPAILDRVLAAQGRHGRFQSRTPSVRGPQGRVPPLLKRQLRPGRDHSRTRLRGTLSTLQPKVSSSVYYTHYRSPSSTWLVLRARVSSGVLTRFRSKDRRLKPRGKACRVRDRPQGRSASSPKTQKKKKTEQKKTQQKKKKTK